MRLFVKWVLGVACMLVVLCVPARAFACVFDSDCDVGDVCCSDGNCYTGSCPSFGCTSDADCAVGDCCNSGSCGSCGSSTCTSDADCGSGECCGTDGLCSSSACPQCAADEVDCSDGSCCPIAFPICCSDGSCATTSTCTDTVVRISGKGGKGGGSDWGCNASGEHADATWLLAVMGMAALALGSRKRGAQ